MLKKGTYDKGYMARGKKKQHLSSREYSVISMLVKKLKNKNICRPGGGGAWENLKGKGKTIFQVIQNEIGRLYKYVFLYRLYL